MCALRFNLDQIATWCLWSGLHVFMIPRAICQWEVFELLAHTKQVKSRGQTKSDSLVLQVSLKTETGAVHEETSGASCPHRTRMNQLGTQLPITLLQLKFKTRTGCSNVRTLFQPIHRGRGGKSFSKEPCAVEGLVDALCSPGRVKE